MSDDGVAQYRVEEDMFKLSDDDGRAVDMLLDTSATSNGNGGHAFSAAPAPFRQRLETVESILNLLKEMPQIDPPKTLVARTLQAVERRRGKRAAKFAPAQSDQSQHRRPTA
ncbi:MAG TPA: hypothetical protein VGQ99_18755 [Tepidisphaeraceae bacterium]|nr:hypothetical protein [Tepidisphaeraceae bacterium]HEV8607383.1 hypothetical protein [Tepidisphaeraceae bacterium]